MEKELKVCMDQEDIYIKTDRIRLLQCIKNLLSNAIKFSEKESIKITTKNHRKQSAYISYRYQVLE